MDRVQFDRFVKRVAETLDYVPEASESELMRLLRASLVSHPARTPKVQLAHEMNRLFLFLGPAKTRYLMWICDAAHVNFDENMTKSDVGRLMEYFDQMKEEFDEEGISL